MTPSNTVAALTLLLLTQSLCVSTGFICPNLSYLDSSVQLICTGGSISHKYINPRGVDVAQCPLIKDRPCTPANASASVISSTQTVFNVMAVTTKDAGTWSCDFGVNEVVTCNLTVAKTPSCSITSKEDTDVLAQYQELTLTVDIQNYYCSTALTFSLQTGNVTTLLIEADSVASVTHNTSSVTLNVMDSHLGIVRLIFNCHNSQWNLTCDGVIELKTPTCSITSDKDNDRLALNEELTLSVNIIGYNCPVVSNFTLQTGNVQQLLNVSGAGAVIDRATQTFHVTKTHLGGVRLMFNCQQTHWNLTCAGITKLQNVGLATASTIIMVACIVGAIVFLIIVVIIIVFLVKRKQVTRIKPQPSVKPPSPPFPSVELNDLPNGSKNISVINAGGYACPWDVVNRSSSRTEDESLDLSLVNNGRVVKVFVSSCEVHA
ncbi:uncharacterized protein LOC125375944 [Haliotis rufescens]|uniref:uncharacterized protein LOC125375944 n=1 Tax=Haliotis rufescens TaxID=6454 RepID=UPI00201F87EB|nr:uncharacterized protein LOC125375944 [Haliotis rufescens]